MWQDKNGIYIPVWLFGKTRAYYVSVLPNNQTLEDRRTVPGVGTKSVNWLTLVSTVFYACFVSASAARRRY